MPDQHTKTEQQNPDQQGNEKLVKSKFWHKLLPLIGTLPFAKDLLSAYYCALDYQTPFKTRAILFSALAYFILPFDLIPDFIPIIGYSDDAAAIAAAIAAVKGDIKQEHIDAANNTFNAHQKN